MGYSLCLNVNVKNDTLNHYGGVNDLTMKGESRRKFQRYTTYTTVIVVVVAAAVAGYWIYQAVKPRPKLPPPITLMSGIENEWYDPGTESWQPAVELTLLHPVWEKTIGPRGESVGIDAPWMWKTDMPLGVEEEVVYDSVVTFRGKKFTLLDGFKISGSIVITADNEYRLHINGNLVGSDAEVQDAETYDISAYLHPGENEITIEVVNLGMPEAWPDHPEWNPAGVIYQADISYSV